MNPPKDLHLHIKLSAEDRENLENLSSRWRTPMAETIRRAIREITEQYRNGGPTK